MNAQRHWMISKNINKFELMILNVHNIPNTGIVDAKEAISMYTKFEHNYLCDGFPITKMDDLILTKSCIPTNHTEMDATINTIIH